MTTTATAQVKERPILFSGPMVKAILEGRKTQTRRVIKTFPQWMHDGHFGEGNPVIPELSKTMCDHWLKSCPYGQPVDRLWVRETWQEYREHSESQNAAIKASIERIRKGESKDVVKEVSSWPFPANGERRVLYAADFGDWAYDADSDLKPWRPSIFMPRKLSRINLEITSVRVERVQDISHPDAEAEGAVWSGDPDGLMGRGNVPKCSMTGDTDWRHCFDTATEAFAHGWNKLNAKRGFSWESNPFVWVIEFRRLTP